ncbi:hypothetical protein TCSYLVIO_009330 [Trypanosoma cruzi]|nr:hypothetical protein TCSYLVIO_009330 [Trypanosoma cruzi]
MDWMWRPPPEPPPRAGFRISPLSRDELYAFVDAYTKDYGITQSSPREERFFRSSIPPWSAASAHRVTIGVELPIDLSITDEEELIREKRRVSEEALALHSHRSWILATDGGVDVPKSAGVGILLSSLNSSEIIEKASINGGTRPCSRTTESRALLPAMERLMIPRIRHRRKNPACGYGQSVSSSGSKQGPAQSDRLDGGSGLAASLDTDVCRLVRAPAVLLRTLWSTC